MLENFKKILKSTPTIGRIIAKISNRNQDYFTNSPDYWDRRYKSGGNSGAGSYNRLAEFKAEYLNDFVARNNVKSVIEFGSGDGAQLKLAMYPKYVGIDVSQTAVDICRKLFSHDSTKTFLHTLELDVKTKAELVLSLDVIYHLVEDDIFHQYMEKLFDTADKYVVIYASNTDGWPVPHVRHRTFVDWVSRNRPIFSLESTTKNKYPFDASDPENTSFADFFVFTRGLFD